MPRHVYVVILTWNIEINRIVRPSLILKFYQLKQIRHTDLSVTYVITVLIEKTNNSLNCLSQMENVWPSQHGIFAFKNLFSCFCSFKVLYMCNAIFLNESISSGMSTKKRAALAYGAL